MQKRPLILHPTTLDAPQKPVVLLLPTGGICEFASLENAQAYLTTAKKAGARAADDAALFSYDFKKKEWKRVV